MTAEGGKEFLSGVITIANKCASDSGEATYTETKDIESGVNNHMITLPFVVDSTSTHSCAVQSVSLESISNAQQIIFPASVGCEPADATDPASVAAAAATCTKAEILHSAPAVLTFRARATLGDGTFILTPQYSITL